MNLVKHDYFFCIVRQKILKHRTLKLLVLKHTACRKTEKIIEFQSVFFTFILQKQHKRYSSDGVCFSIIILSVVPGKKVKS